MIRVYSESFSSDEDGIKQDNRHKDIQCGQKGYAKINGGTLEIMDDGNLIAAFADGCWNSFERVNDDTPKADCWSLA